jgi:apoptosis-inducing factor 2
MHSSQPLSDPLNPISPISNLSLSSSDSPSPPETLNSAPHRILIVGGAYAGITAVLNLLDLAQGKQERPSVYELPNFEGRKSRRGIEITVIDERDGFCRFPFLDFSLLVRWLFFSKVE